MIKKTLIFLTSVLILASCAKPKKSSITPTPEEPGVVGVESKEETSLLSSSSSVITESSSASDASSSSSEGDGPIEGPIVLI